jgi:IPT/TIG domain/Cytochrome C oxidase subunit II, periplasmic domain
MRTLFVGLLTAVLSLSMTKAPTGVTRTFDITARQFSYTVTPFPFSAKVGDTVVIRATSGDVVHGLAMDPYVTDALTLVPGETVTKTFVADRTGRFTFACTSFCGEFHSFMADSFFVYSPDTPSPAIDSLAPMSGSVKGTLIAINGSNFARDAKVRIADAVAPSAFISSTQIYASASPHAPGVVPVTVINADGQFASANFIYEAPPAPARRRAVRP